MSRACAVLTVRDMAVNVNVNNLLCAQDPTFGAGVQRSRTTYGRSVHYFVATCERKQPSGDVQQRLDAILMLPTWATRSLWLRDRDAGYAVTVWKDYASIRSVEAARV